MKAETEMEKQAEDAEGFIADFGFQLLEDSRDLPRLKGPRVLTHEA